MNNAPKLAPVHILESLKLEWAVTKYHYSPVLQNIVFPSANFVLHNQRPMTNGVQQDRNT